MAELGNLLWVGIDMREAMRAAICSALGSDGEREKELANAAVQEFERFWDPPAPTANELGNAFLDDIETASNRVGPSPAGREFALAKTHLEDALTRYNSGRYRENGTWKRADPDLPEGRR